MKKFLLAALLLFFAAAGFAQKNSWTFVKGYGKLPKYPTYGTQGTAAKANSPGARQASVSWESNGKLYLFGGYGSDASNNSGYLNDLWVYDTTAGTWTWLKGSNTINQQGLYGTQGTADPANTPGARQYASGWQSGGKFYLLGGLGFDVNNSNDKLNDLWVYDPATNNWTWLKGSNIVNQAGIYGNLGNPGNANSPGARYGAATWPSNGKLYMMGGNGIDINGNGGELNDVWVFDPAINKWAWLNGANTVNQAGTYGTQGTADIANAPGGRERAVSWVNNGKFYLFGGAGYDASSNNGNLNDLWVYDPAANNWAWLKGSNAINQNGTYGTLGTANPANTPGARLTAVSWQNAGKLYLFGGTGFDATGNNDNLNDLWVYDPTTNNWAWLKGSNAVNQNGTYGTLGTADPVNIPGARQQATSWLSGGKLYMMGGYGFDVAGAQGSLPDLWVLDPATTNWTWINGTNSIGQPGIYGTQGTAATANVPGARNGAVTWQVGSKFYMFGGSGSDAANNSDYLNDLWVYDQATNNWTWLKGGNTINQAGIYGTQGIADPANTPGARQNGVSWLSGGKLYMYGGTNSYNYYGYVFSDLWVYDPATNNWTWLKGSSALNAENPISVTQGAADPSNTPGGRQQAVSWTVGTKLYFFGGISQYAQGNDLWVYDITTNNWTYLKGAFNNQYSAGTYGTKGTANGANTPGSRTGATGWQTGGKLYLFGGSGRAASIGDAGPLNDLWVYDPATNNWTWLNGTNTANQTAVYGTRNTPAAINTPGGLYNVTPWVSNGKIYLFGGIDNFNQHYNDLWVYDPATNYWAWINGSAAVDQPGSYNTQGVSDPANTPGGRNLAMSWENNGILYLFGGNGIGVNNDNDNRGDLWSIAEVTSTDPNLVSLAINPGTLAPVFDGNTTSYTATVNTATITVTPTTTNGATAKVNGTTVAGGTASQPIALALGSNTINTVVTAEDGTTTKTYTVTVTRLSNDATLSGLSTLPLLFYNPSFASGTTAYTATVTNSTTSVSLNATANQNNATIKTNGTTVSSGSFSAPIALNVGSNTISTVVTAQDGTTTQTYTLTITRQSNDATLSNLALSAGTLTPTFAGGTIGYTASVSNATTSITLTPTVNQANATVKVNGTTVASGSASGAIALNVGSNTITTVVTAQDVSFTQTYTLTITRAASAVATLNNLTASAGTLTPTFASNTTAYTKSVSNSTISTTITPTVTDNTATVTVNGTAVTSGSDSQTIALTVGSNIITTVVTAQDGTTTKTYTVTVTRAPAAIAALSNLTLSAATLTPAFATGTNAYTASVGNATTGITVTPTTTDNTATVKVNGVTVTSGSASQLIALNVGSNTITTVITAQDGTTTKTYTVTITRISNDATLSNLTLSTGALTPAFAGGTTSYTANVSNAINSITLTPTVNQANASVKVNGTTVLSGTASQAIALNVGSNTITTVVTAQDGTTTQTYTVAITRAPSSVTTLSNLTLSAGTLAPTFTSSTTIYTVSVSNATNSITLTPTVAQTNATVKVNGVNVNSGTASGPISLNVGSNTVTTIVTAQDGFTTQTYTVNVTRAASAVATLANLAISAGSLTPTFASGTTNYNAGVSNAVTSITVTPAVTQPNAIVTVNGTAVNSGSASQTIVLGVGNNLVTTVVTAQDGTTTQTYSITINRTGSPNANLSSLTLSSGTLTPTFAAGTTSYTASVSNATNSFTVTPTVAQTNATITVNGVIVNSGSASQAIALNVGSNTITTVVTAQDGATTQTYTITVTRANPPASTIATLNSLSLSAGSLTPAFASGTTSYTASVSNTTNSITVTPTVSQANATVTVNGIAVTSGSTSQAVTLNVGSNTITTIVTAQDGSTTQTYTVTVTRANPPASIVATLSSLTLSAGALSPTFATGTTSYNSGVSNATTTITVTPASTDNTATIKVNGVAVASGTSSQSIALSVGSNTVTTVVTAQDGITTQTYTVAVTRAMPQVSTVATLANLSLSTGTLTPAFSSGTTSYTAIVGNTTTNVTVTPTTTDNTAAVKVNGVTVNSGTPSQAIALNVGSNTITTIVTAQDGTTIQTYTVVITRAAALSQSRTITFNNLPGSTFGAADFNPGASISSGETPVYSSSNIAVATIVNGSIHIVGAGNSTITATAPANANYAATAPVSQVLIVNKAQQTISFPAIPDQVKGTSYSFSSVRSSTGSLVTFTTVDPFIASVSGSTLNALSIGQTNVVADAAGNANYYGAQSVVQTVNVVSNDPANPVIVHQAISPNGDGINDTFQLEGIAEHPNNDVSIYTKNGVLIYHIENYDNNDKAFDGHSNYTGALMQAGTYFYVLTYADKGQAVRKIGTLVIKY